MATRFYFHQSTDYTAPISPAVDAGWARSRSPFTRRLSLRRKTETGFVTFSALFGATTTSDTCYGQWVTEPLTVAETISGTVSMVLWCDEGGATEHQHLGFVLRVLSGDGSVVRGTLASVLTTSTEMSVSPVVETRTHVDVALTPVAALLGDRLALEIGMHGVTPANLSANIIVAGASEEAADYDLANGITTLLTPWWELSQNLQFWFPLPLAPTQRMC